MDSAFWKKLSIHYSTENNTEVVMQDNLCSVKSICEVTQYLSDVASANSVDSPATRRRTFRSTTTYVGRATGEKDKNKQRAAAEFIAGILTGTPIRLNSERADTEARTAGSKHWPTDLQDKFWKWFMPHAKSIFNQKSNDTLSVWSSFFEVRSPSPTSSMPHLL